MEHKSGLSEIELGSKSILLAPSADPKLGGGRRARPVWRLKIGEVNFSLGARGQQGYLKVKKRERTKSCACNARLEAKRDRGLGQGSQGSA